jgi:hypothetical protein
MLPIAPEFASATALQPATAQNAAAQAAAAQEAAAQAAAQEATLQDLVNAANKAAQAALQDVPQPPPPPGAPVGVDVPGMGPVVPMTRDQVRALDRRGNDLSNQLQSAQGRRDRIAEELENTTDPAAREGLIERLKFLDGRLVALEGEISANGEAKASIAAKLGTMSAEAPPSNIPDWVPPLAFLTMLPITLAVVRLLWKRGNRPPVVPITPQAEARFSELEQAIDSVAVEIERVAEGQRFVTKLLREGQPLPDFTARAGAEAVPLRADREAGR